MTRHKHAHIGLGTPSPLDHWINATLRAFAMLVLNVASTLQMIRRRAAVNATQPTPTDLPQAKTDTHQETTAAQQSSSIALILRSAAKLRVSKDEGVLTAASRKLPQRQDTPPPSGEAQSAQLARQQRSGGGQSSLISLTTARAAKPSPTCIARVHAPAHAHPPPLGGG